MQNLMINPKTGKTTSLELVNEINLFREQDGNKTELGHNDVLKIIRDEFEEEIGMGILSHTPYVHPQNKQTYQMYHLTISQSTSVLVRESKFVRKAVIAKLEEASKPKEISKAEFALMLYESEVEKERLEMKVENLSTALDSLVEWISIIKVAAFNSVHETLFSWHKLKKKSIEMGYEVKKAQSPRFQSQNLYHVNAFRACYPQYNYKFLNNNSQLTLR